MGRCRVFAQNARDAGVTLNVENIPGDQMYNPIERYLRWELVQIPSGSNSPIARFISGALLSDSGFNETAWRFEDFDATFRRAVTTADRALRKRLLDELQVELHDRGPFVIPLEGDAVVATSARVSGLTTRLFWRKDGLGNLAKVSIA